MLPAAAHVREHVVGIRWREESKQKVDSSWTTVTVETSRALPVTLPCYEYMHGGHTPAHKRLWDGECLFKTDCSFLAVQDATLCKYIVKVAAQALSAQPPGQSAVFHSLRMSTARGEHGLPFI
jgi:hypothetical protein